MYITQIITCNSLLAHEISAVRLIFVSGKRGQAHVYLGRGIKEMERYRVPDHRTKTGSCDV